MRSLDEFATAKLGELERSSLRRALVDTTRVTAIWLLRNGRRLLSFCCNDYLNLTHHPAVKHVESLLAQLRRRHRRALIATDGVFSMDGDIAPLHGLAALAQRHDAWLMSDDAHGLGVVGGGRGSNFIEGMRAEVPLQMGTLSKALGSYGGYICASAAVVDLIRNRARTVIYSTGLPPAIVAAAIAALDVIER